MQYVATSRIRMTLSRLNCAVQFLFVLCFVRTFGLESGESCTLENGDQGLCKYLTDCTPALELLKKGSFPKVLCANGIQLIVCCEDVNPVTKAPVMPRIQLPSPQVVTNFVTSNRQPGEISKEKCKEYSKYVWDTSEVPILLSEHRRSNTFECPFEKLPLVVGGDLASRREFPHMALVGYSQGYETEWSCGGTLISENYVLTASHCLRHNQLGLAKLVRVGMTNRSDTSNMQERKISEVRYHPEYKSSARYNDIALLKLSESVVLDTYARPACLHTKKEISTSRAIASGWGHIGFTSPDSNDLLKVILDFFDNQSCNNTYKKEIGKKIFERGILDDLMICAGSHKEMKDTCEGDSGGPLQVYHEDRTVECMYSIVGVTSFGKACGLTKDVPGVYTRISSYIKWIEDVVWPEV